MFVNVVDCHKENGETVAYNMHITQTEEDNWHFMREENAKQSHHISIRIKNDTDIISKAGIGTGEIKWFQIIRMLSRARFFLKNLSFYYFLIRLF